MKKILGFLLAVCMGVNGANAQEMGQMDSAKTTLNVPKKFNYKPYIIPAALMTYGVLGLKSGALQTVNMRIKNAFNKDGLHKTSADDYLVYSPSVAVYALNLLGVKGKHDFKDRTIILGTSLILAGGTVFALKDITHVERPDHSAFNSFPSGHTALAFAGAEFMWQEYKDVSVWYGISGYVLAMGTGMLRIYNDKHWFNDVAMGAGLGILSSKIAYCVFPFMKNHIFKGNKNVNTAMVMPFYNGRQMGLGMMVNLK